MNILVSACLLGAACRYDGRSKPCPGLEALMARHTLIPVCPECYGGLPTPRPPAERRGERVITQNGLDVTVQYEKGAREALRLAQLYGCQWAILKERSPSCGAGTIYDGSFSRTTVPGDGVTARLLAENGIRVLGESQLDLLPEE
ncbi:MAG: DUF523 domain-containing protein [Candidatus Onthomonas sp.]